MSKLRFETASSSRVGNRRVNQDRCAIVQDGDDLFLVLADGMGGQPKGEEAARILVDTCCDVFRKSAKPITRQRDFLRTALNQSHALISRYGRRFAPPIDPRTTAVLLVVCGTTASWAHVGDSRLYLFRSDQEPWHTEDHSYVRELFREGGLSEEECATHPLRNFVTRSVGGIAEPEVEASIEGPRELYPGDILLLCSDGLWGPLSETRIHQWIADPALQLPTALERMVADAESTAQPVSDNVTAAVLRLVET